MELESARISGEKSGEWGSPHSLDFLLRACPIRFIFLLTLKEDVGSRENVGLVLGSGSHCPKGRIGFELLLFLFWSYTAVGQNVKGKKFHSQPQKTEIRVNRPKKKKNLGRIYIKSLQATGFSGDGICPFNYSTTKQEENYYKQLF